MKPNIQRDIKFINKCGCLVDLKLLEKAMIWYSKGNTLKSIKKIFLNGKYPAVSIYNNKIHIHRLIMCYNLKNIIPTNLYVHHKDGNKLNSKIENLEIIEASIHQSLHNSGKTLSENHKKLISQANSNRLGMKYKKKTIHENK